MTRARTAVVVSALLLALPACSSDAKPTAAPTTAPAASSAAPATSNTVDDRAVCRANVNTANALDLDPATNLANGEAAAHASDRGIAAAGGKLVAAGTAAKTATDTASANLDIREAQRGLAEACAAVYGDGSW